jgi:hypothetical protein
MRNKPLTKALHTVRVVRAIAEHVRATTYAGRQPSALLVYAAVLSILGNVDTFDAELHNACLEACKAVQS